MINFEKIYERDIDLIIMRSFVCVSGFAQLFLEKTVWTNAKIISIEHSLTHPKFGESDITVIIESDGIKAAILIENKIDADNMPNQYGRYVARGNDGVGKGEYKDFAVFITAPQKYLNTNFEAQKYPNYISYETMLTFFENNGLVFEYEAIKAAVEKKESGYTVVPDDAVTDFWNKLYERSKELDVKMKEPKREKGSSSLWVYFHTPLRGTMLIFKSDQGTVELEFTGKINEIKRLKDDLKNLKETEMHWKSAGKSLSLYMNVEKTDFRKPFEQHKDDVDTALSKVKQLFEFAMYLNDIGYVV